MYCKFIERKICVVLSAFVYILTLISFARMDFSEQSRIEGKV